MPKPGKLVFLMLALLLGNVHLGSGQINVDESRSIRQLGSLRGQVITRISDSEEDVFLVFMNEFFNQRSFKRISPGGTLEFSKRNVVLDWYERQDGVTVLVTDLTAPEKMRVVFYDCKDGSGAVEAEQTFLEFEALSLRFRRYE